MYINLDTIEQTDFYDYELLKKLNNIFDRIKPFKKRIFIHDNINFIIKQSDINYFEDNNNKNKLNMISLEKYIHDKITSINKIINITNNTSTNINDTNNNTNNNTNIGYDINNYIF